MTQPTIATSYNASIKRNFSELNNNAPNENTDAKRVKQLSIDFFLETPDILIAHIASFCEQIDRINFSVFNKRIKEIVDNAQETLTLTMPSDYAQLRADQRKNRYFSLSTPLNNEEQQMKSNGSQLLERIVRRFQNIRTICLGSEYKLFKECDGDIIRPLITILENNYPKKLQQVKLYTIPKLTTDCLDPFAHSQTLSLEISDCQNPPAITDETINSTLEKTDKLISFIFNLQEYNEINLEIKLSQCPNLEIVRLSNMSIIGNTTIEHLGRCRNLKELSVKGTLYGTAALERFLCTDHGLQLRVLDLEGTRCLGNDNTLDLATKYLTDLEIFFSGSFKNNRISDPGLVKIAHNCKKLDTLIFNFENITDVGMHDFAQNAPQLRKLSAWNMNKVTQQGIVGLTQYCPNLAALVLENFSDLTLEVLFVLAKKLKNLRFLTILNSHFKCVSEKNLTGFAKACKALKYLKISDCSGISKDFIKDLTTEIFPRIKSPTPRTFYTI